MPCHPANRIRRYRVAAGVLLGLGLANLGGPVSHAQPALPPPPVTVLVRTADGAPVAGVQLILQPAPADQSGPPTILPARQATTDAQGRASFPPISPWVWMLTLHGTVAGRPLEDPASQGTPPWGTNPAGGGFPILADPTLEADEGIPTPDPTAASAPVLVPLLLVDRGDLWIPALDLGTDHTRPLSLPAAIQTQTGHPASTPTAPARPATSGPITPRPESGLLLGGLLLLLVPVLSLIAGLAFYRRRHPHRPAPAAYLHAAPPAATRRKETDSHA